MSSLKISIIHPASVSDRSQLDKNVASLHEQGFSVVVEDDPAPTNAWKYTSADLQSRLNALMQAMMSDSDIVWAARGGYGVSELLPYLDWAKLKTCKPKTIIGFSDISALLLPVAQKLGWRCLHAPMPGTSLWDSQSSDIRALIDLLQQPNISWRVDIPLDTVSDGIVPAGKLIGGCFSVLTNLIGTPFFAVPNDPWILFLEDTDESPPRLVRYWSQWQQAGYTKNLQAIVVGNLRNLNAEKDVFLDRLKEVSQLPVLSTEMFGHVSPNLPMLLGSHATVSDKTLTWSYKESDLQC